MGIVYVVQKPKPGPSGFVYDISPAQSFGSLAFIFDDTEQPGAKPGPSMHKAQSALRDFCDEDYILWAGGDPAAMAIVAMAASRINNGRVKFLRWERERVGGQRDPKRGYYLPVQISLKGQV